MKRSLNPMIVPLHAQFCWKKIFIRGLSMELKFWGPRHPWSDGSFLIRWVMTQVAGVDGFSMWITRYIKKWMWFLKRGAWKNWNKHPCHRGDCRFMNVLSKLCIYIYTGWWFQPSWKIRKSMGRIIPYIMENKKMFQTTNQYIYIYTHTYL